jgi:hypothetical protein
VFGVEAFGFYIYPHVSGYRIGWMEYLAPFVQNNHDSGNADYTTSFEHRPVYCEKKIFLSKP